MEPPEIKQIQEQIIEMDGVQYHLVDVTHEPLKPHESGCAHCAGNERAPVGDIERFKLFDHYCGRWPLTCEPHGRNYDRRRFVYKALERSSSADRATELAEFTPALLAVGWSALLGI
jgi:hypothetical protein